MPAAVPVSVPATESVIEVDKVATRFGEHGVHTDVSFSVGRAEIFALIGGSGSGKSTLLREVMLLQRPDAGSIRVLGTDLSALADDATVAPRQRWGVMFQRGGLFGALTVKENVGQPLREHTELDDALIDEIAMAKLAMTGLTAEVGAQYPSELSGGMLKRASLARALALDPELLFLDEPTAGLDPVSAEGVDDLVLKLRDLFGLTIFMITHDLDLLWQVADRVAVLADGKVQGVGSMTELSGMDQPSIRQFFSTARAGAPRNRRTSGWLRDKPVQRPGAHHRNQGELHARRCVRALARGGADRRPAMDRLGRQRAQEGRPVPGDRRGVRRRTQPERAGQIQRRRGRQGQRHSPRPGEPGKSAVDLRDRARNADQGRHRGGAQDAGADDRRRPSVSLPERFRKCSSGKRNSGDMASEEAVGIANLTFTS